MLHNPLEGSWEQVHRELEAHSKELRGRQVRFYVVDEKAGKPNKPKTVAEAMKGYIGSCNFGAGNFSRDVKRIFGEAVEEKFRKQGFKF